jgi:lambda family phage portal protein
MGMTGDPLVDELLGHTGEILPPVADAGTPSTVAAAVEGGGASVAYDASDRVEKLAAWRPAIRSADGDILPEKNILDARSRDTGRNDAYVAGGAQLHKDNIVGSNFLLNAKPETKILWGKDDPTWEAEFQEEVETKFTLWAESPQNWLDAQRVKTLTEIVRLAVGVWCAGGEVLGVSEWMRGNFRPYRSAFQMIDTDRLSTPWDRHADPKIRSGVERDYFGAPTAYHIRSVHEGDVNLTGTWEDRMKWRRVPARKPWGRQMVLHIYDQMRPDQTRGVAAMATALTEMRMTKRFRQTELERAIIAASYAASIETELPPGEVYAAMGDSAEDNPSVAWASDFLGAVSEYSGGAKNLHINGSRIPVFWPGTSLKIQNPGAASPAGDQFEASLLRYIAAAMGVSYEQLSRDYTQTNYSSARASMAETWKAMQVKKKKIADRTATFIYRLWLEEAINYNHLECLKRQNVPAFYEGLNAEAYSGAEWLGAGQGMIDPLKETQADVLAIKNGLMTKEAAIARRSGTDYRKVAKQRGRERDLDHELDLPSVHDGESSDMENALSGTPQERES